jgi:hypothetical protein
MGGAEMTPIHPNSQIGIQLDERLGLQLPRREGHDLAGPCIECKSSDAFRLHQQTGVAQCYSCHGKWSPFQLAEAVLKDREQAKALLIEIGVFQSNGQALPAPDPITAIAQSKGITPDSLRAFGARATSPKDVALSAYGPDGKPCTTFTMSVEGGKGLFAKGKHAGLFFPHVDGKVRLPKHGETWHLVEGPKDAAALHGLGLLACGLNTCRLAAKFARLFTGVNIILVPDRDRAGEDGGKFSAGVLRGAAKSLRIAVLPAEFKESDGADVRDVLRGPGGRELVLQAIADALQPEEWEIEPIDESAATSVASVEIALPEGDPIKLEVSPAGRQPQRLVVAIRGTVEHRDRINTDSSHSRERFINKLATKVGVERDGLAPLIEPKMTKLASEIDAKAPAPSGKGDDDAQSQATLAANMAADWELWHTPGKLAYATILLGSHKENWPVRSQMFKQFLAKQFYDDQGKAMNSEALAAAINLIEAKAQFDGDEHPVHVRVAEHDGHIYLDLCNPEWQVVKVTPQGWDIVDDPPVRFRRSRGMIALPTPERGGTVDQLRGFLNIDDNAWRLVIAWLVATLRPRGPYPILALFAEQGAGKSTIGRLLRELIDPNAAPLRAEPNDGRDLMIAANNSWCMAYDNLSHVPPWLSDAMCRLSTGGGFSTRELYSDSDEIIFDSQRPLLLTSIEEVASRSDLLDRCLIVWLPAIPEDRRRSEAELFEAFHKVRSKILGALLDAVAVALLRLPSIKLPTLPRMADFAIWATAAETAFGWPSGTFVTAYQGNRESANEVALEASVVARPLLDLLEAQGEWNGSSGELLKALEEREGEQIRKQSGWPKNPRSLSGHLTRLAPNLREAGWEAISPKKNRTAKTRLWTIRRLRGDASTSSNPQPSLTASPEDQGDSMPSDADWFNVGQDDADDAGDTSAGNDWNPARY